MGLVTWLAVALMAAVQLGGAFGSATADAEPSSASSIVLNLEVDVRASAQAVVAHLTFQGEPDIALPLLDRGGGSYGIRTEIKRQNYLVVFEAIGAVDGLSIPVSLAELGVELGSLGGVSTSSTPDDGLFSAETRGFGWLALGLAAASLSALAFWVLGGRDRDGELVDEEE